MKIVKLKPATKDYIWGGNRLIASGKEASSKNLAEAWELSVHPDGLSQIDSGPYKGRFLKDIMTRDDMGKFVDKFPEFPLLVKLVDADANLAVQVHPGDEYAKKNERSLGKTELWYITHAEEGSGIYLGFRKDVTIEEIKEALNKNTILDLLNYIPVKEGDSFNIPAGTIHSIGKGVTLLEISSSSNVNYRIYDYGRLVDGKPRNLSLDKAFDVLNLSAYETKKFQGTVIGRSKYFVSWLEDQSNPQIKASKDSFLTLTIVDGEGSLDGISFKKYDTFFIPAGYDARLAGASFKYILTGVPH